MNEQQRKLSKLNLSKAIEFFNGQTALAAACAKASGRKIVQSHVWNWLHRDDAITIENAMIIEKASGGKFPKNLFRPDIFDDGPTAT